MAYRDWELSWSRSNRCFRFIRMDDPEVVVYCTSAEGEFDFIDTENVNGRLYLHCQLKVNGGHATLEANPERQPELPPPGSVELFKGYCRICFRRSNGDWRARDEKVNGRGTGKVHFVKSYRGRCKLYWYDKASHLFHGHPDRMDGEVWQGPDGMAYVK